MWCRDHQVRSSPIRGFGRCEGVSEALALSVELRSSLGILPEDAGWEALVVPPVVPFVPLEKFLLELLGAMLAGAPVSVELGSAVPAQMRHSPESMPSLGDGMLLASAGGALCKASPCCAQPCHSRSAVHRVEELHCGQALSRLSSQTVEPFCLHSVGNRGFPGNVICMYHIRAKGSCTSFHIE